MSALTVTGGRPLSGRIEPSANKNAVLPVLCATLLTDAPVTLRNVPDITDVHRIVDFFGELGSGVTWDKRDHRLEIDHSSIRANGAGGARARLPQAMRASIMMIPGLLWRLGEARLEHEVKGCTLGAREIDPHVAVFRAFGAETSSGGREMVFRNKHRAEATRMWLEYASVTTTENFVISALTAHGRSEIVNAACEPHVQELCSFLEQMGAVIHGKGTSTLAIEGADGRLGGADYTFAEDYHEIATFLALAAVTGGDVSVRNRRPDHFMLIDRTFEKFGAQIEHADGFSRLVAPPRLKVQENFTQHLTTKVEAAPWPYIPADLLPIFIALGVKAQGQVMFWNKVYEGGLTWHTELSLFGAHTLLCDPHRLITFGTDRLVPATVTSPYIIRVAIALLMIASSIEGESRILDADPIRRAHPNFVDNFDMLGAKVRWGD